MTQDRGQQDVGWMKVRWKLDGKLTDVGRKFDEKLTDVRRNGNATDSTTDAMMLQNARELCSDGGRDTLATTL